MLIWRGIRLGALAGGVLSVAYTTVVIPLVGVLLVGTNVSTGKAFDALLGAGMFAMAAWVCAIPLGVLPGILIGSIGGFLIAAIALPMKTKLSRRGAVIIGLFVGAIIVAAAHALLFPGLIQTQMSGVFKYVPYFFWLLAPSALTLAGSAWVGWKIVGANLEAGEN